MKSKLRKFLLVLVVAFALVIGYYAYTLYAFTNSIHDAGTSTANGFEPAKTEIPVWAGTERVNVLLMGTDTRRLRPSEQPRSDSMILVSIDPVGKTYDIFSIMRDTYIQIADRGRARINEALPVGGPQLAMRTVSEFTGVPVHYYVQTDFEGFKSLIDTGGGVEIDVEKRMYYHDPTDKGVYDINLKKGLQRLDGEKALQYVRFRYDVMSDYTRTERQRKLLKSLATELKSGKTILQLPSVLESVQPYIKTNMTPVDMLRMATLGVSLDNPAPTGYQLPPMGMFLEENHGGQVIVPDIQAVQQYVQEVLNKEKSKG